MYWFNQMAFSGTLHMDTSQAYTHTLQCSHTPIVLFTSRAKPRQLRLLSSLNLDAWMIRGNKACSEANLTHGWEEVIFFFFFFFGNIYSLRAGYSSQLNFFGSASLFLILHCETTRQMKDYFHGNLGLWSSRPCVNAVGNILGTWNLEVLKRIPWIALYIHCKFHLIISECTSQPSSGGLCSIFRHISLIIIMVSKESRWKWEIFVAIFIRKTESICDDNEKFTRWDFKTQYKRPLKCNLPGIWCFDKTYLRCGTQMG